MKSPLRKYMKMNPFSLLWRIMKKRKFWRESVSFVRSENRLLITLLELVIGFQMGSLRSWYALPTIRFGPRMGIERQKIYGKET